ncbi:MAG: sulfatase-like hydrolase/transferase [Acidobacteriota bacterium]
MTGGSMPFLLLRAIFGGIFALSSVYCLLAYVPFTYQQVIVNELIGWVSAFPLLHHWLYWIALVCGAWTVVDDIRPGRLRWLILGFMAIWSAIGVWVVLARPMMSLRNDWSALIWAALWLAPPCWLALVDLAARVPRLDWRFAAPENSRLFWATFLAGAFTAGLYAAIFAIRFGADPHVRLTSSDRLVAGVWSLLLHLVAYMGAFAALSLVRALASRLPRPSLAEFVLVCAGGGIVLAGVGQALLLSALSLSGRPAWVIASAAGGAAAVCLAGIAVRMWPDHEAVRSGLDLALRPLSPVSRGGRTGVAWLVALAALAYGLAWATAVVDWNYLLQKAGVLAVWTLVFASVHGTIRSGRERLATVLFMVVPVALVLSYRSLSAAPKRLAVAGLTPSADLALVLDTYGGYDVSFKVLHDLVRVERTRVAPDTRAFYELLQRQTNIPRTTAIVPHEMPIAKDLTPSTERKPHIFIIGVDSLRQDYVSPYNPGVDFTPSLGQLARDSTVFRQAFTRYGATGLAEPTWFTGALLPHQQYPNPFGPMNNLQQLVMSERYRPFVTVDSVLRATLARWPDLVELDRGVPGNRYDLCRTLEELTGHLTSPPAGDDRPVFAFTLAQNVHVSSIARERASVPAGEVYPGFYAPYASRVRRIDGCIGSFIGMLKARGLYENSVLIFTSDHGDSLGEDGRWGHAYTIFPEIIRIPLVIHLPRRWQRLAVDPDALAFSTDVAPTLFYLLGHRPTVNHPLFGRPLFTERPGERRAYLRDDYVVASSYGPVYGLLRDGGRSLYVVDAASFRDYDFDMTTGPAGTPRRVSDTVRSEAQARIRKTVEEIASYYRIPLNR